MDCNLITAQSLDLSLESLEAIEVPIEDKEAGIIVGIVLGLGIVAGALLAT